MLDIIIIYTIKYFSWQACVTTIVDDDELINLQVIYVLFTT